MLKAVSWQGDAANRPDFNTLSVFLGVPPKDIDGDTTIYFIREVNKGLFTFITASCI